MRHRSESLLSALLLFLASPAPAVIQVSNLSEPLNVEFTANGTNFAHAASFTTDGSAYQLQSVTVSVFTNTTGTSELRLRADASGSPGALIASLGSQTLPSNQGNVLLTYNAAATPLSANTTYWVTLGETGSGDFQWDGTTSTAESSPGSWTIGDQDKFSSDGGSSWADVNFGPPNESAKFAVDATAVSASGEQYSMTGKFARSNGAFIDIPQVVGGGGNCGLTTMGGAMVPGMTPIVQGVKTTLKVVPDPVTTLPIPTRFANPRGCVSGMGKITATMAGLGAAFNMPTKAFVALLPGTPRAMSVPLVGGAPVVQLLTSFAVTGPPKTVGTGKSAPGGTMIVRVPNTPMGVPQNLAMFRSFHQSAWKTQTGRAGAKFTWCLGNPNCTRVSQAGTVKGASAPLIVKYTPGPNRFGGTMSHVVTSGPNPSNLAFGTPGGIVSFEPLGGSAGIRPTGRGYADHRMNVATFKTRWLMHMTGPVVVAPLMTVQSLITTLMTPTMIPLTFSNNIYGFPFTTGTVVVRNTGYAFVTPNGGGNSPVVVTLTAMGADAVTPMGARNISLVAGGLAAVTIDPFFPTARTLTPTLNQISMPEPAELVQLVTGAIALLGIAAWRARKRRA